MVARLSNTADGSAYVFSSFSHFHLSNAARRCPFTYCEKVKLSVRKSHVIETSLAPVYAVISLTFALKFENQKYRKNVFLFRVTTLRKNATKPNSNYRQINATLTHPRFACYSFIYYWVKRSWNALNDLPTQSSSLHVQAGRVRWIWIACPSPFERVDLIEPLLFTIEIY